ncbi:MAG: GNAT family N-acetyltransferase [Fimbriimonas sp.]
MLRPDYPIETERLLLRPFRAEDLDAYAAYRSREDVCRYLYLEPRPREALQETVLARMTLTQIAREGDQIGLVAELRKTGEVIGDVVLRWTSEIHRSGEVGYCFHPSYHGHGYATEAAEAMLRLGFEGLGLHRIVGRLDGRNEASARVLARLGMRREAHLVENEWVKGEWTDEVVYAMLDREWSSRHP